MVRSVPFWSAPSWKAGDICAPHLRTVLRLPPDSCRSVPICGFTTWITHQRLLHACEVRSCWILLPALLSPRFQQHWLYLIGVINFSKAGKPSRCLIHNVAAVWWYQCLSSFFSSGCWSASTAWLNVTHSQVPHIWSSGPLNTLLLAAMLHTFRAGLELAFLYKVTPPVWLQCLGNPEFCFPQCLWLSSVAALKQNYLSNNLKCFASINELSLPVSWDGEY